MSRLIESREIGGNLHSGQSPSLALKKGCRLFCEALKQDINTDKGVVPSEDMSVHSRNSAAEPGGNPGEPSPKS